VSEGDVTGSDVTGIDVIRPKVGDYPWGVILVTLFPVRAASGDVTSSNPCVMACSPLLLPKYALSYPDILH
jgi:hypothetical protein